MREELTQGYARSRLNAAAIRRAFFALRFHAARPKWLRRCIGEDRLAVSQWQTEHSSLDRFERKKQLFKEVFSWDTVRGKITYTEFGVSSGRSLKWVVALNSHPDSRFVGFDTFQGLPDDWGRVRKGSFSTGGKPPEIEDPRVGFEIGLFADTLPNFLRTSDLAGERLVIHLDPDLYEPAKYVLTSMRPHLKSGDVLIIGDFCSIKHPSHIFRAWREFLSEQSLEVKYEVTANRGHQLAVSVV
jgi:O-methyltransferase